MHVQLETLQFSWGSSDASGQFPAIRSAQLLPESGPPRLSQQACGFCCCYTHTHTGCAPAVFRGSSQRQALGPVCDNVPHAASRTSIPLPVSRDTRYLAEVPGLPRHLPPEEKRKKTFRSSPGASSTGSKAAVIPSGGSSGAGAGQPLVAASQEMRAPNPCGGMFAPHSIHPNKPQPVLLDCPIAQKYGSLDSASLFYIPASLLPQPPLRRCFLILQTPLTPWVPALPKQPEVPRDTSQTSGMCHPCPQHL